MTPSAHREQNEDRARGASTGARERAIDEPRTTFLHVFSCIFFGVAGRLPGNTFCCLRRQVGCLAACRSGRVVGPRQPGTNSPSSRAAQLDLTSSPVSCPAGMGRLGRAGPEPAALTPISTKHWETLHWLHCTFLVERFTLGGIHWWHIHTHSDTCNSLWSFKPKFCGKQPKHEITEWKSIVHWICN